ncbi:MAG: thioredoxin-like domain-containing protein [Actinomycetota bacterium]|nr:thioredoxin-like domain-containing protein [Actinomycetota bacterium]
MSGRIAAVVCLATSTLTMSCSTPSTEADNGALLSSTTSSRPSTTPPDSAPNDVTEFTYKGEVAAPDVPNGLDWFNVARPLSLVTDLRGKIVILDFWTQGCINCLHVIPDLHRLEEEFPDSLAVIGVHWAKFDHERTSEAIGKAIQRLGIQHPVVNDDHEYLRRSYRVQAWPTLVLIDPLGRVVGVHAGEGVYPLFEPVIDQMTREYGAANLIDVRPLELIAKSPDSIPTVLSFPGKVLADPFGDRLFIADSGHHRVVITELGGRILDVVGGGSPGLANGAWVDARFNQPQGLALSANGRFLYVADRGNHAIRVIDLLLRKVRTFAGTGQPVHRVIPGPPLSTSIASPWDVERIGNQLFIAGAGRHQLWIIDTSKEGRQADWIDIFAGTGAEGIQDGPRLTATLSQPSGLSTDGSTLWFTDPEASAIRSVELKDGDEITTLVGTGLFDWGDSVGDVESTELQHAVGIELVGDSLYIADTYNHRIKAIHLSSGDSVLVAGNGSPGLKDGYGQNAQLAEPSGLSLANDVLFIADTNNHRIRTLNIKTGEVTTLELSNLQAAPLITREAADETVTFAQQVVSPGTVKLSVELLLPAGYEFNDEGTFALDLTIENARKSQVVGRSSYRAQGPQMPQEFNLFIGDEKQLKIEVDITVFYCPAQNATFCLLRHLLLELPIEVGDAGTQKVALTHPLPSAEEIDRSIESGSG